VAAFIGVFGLGLASSARAEMDYEYVKELMARHEPPGFPTDDLVERAIALLAENPASQIDAKLAQASYKRKQASSASPELRTKLLNEADQIYKDILAGEKKHRLHSVAEKDAGSIVSDRINATLSSAKDIEKKDPDAARKLRTDAAAQMAAIAAGYKAEADAKIVAFNVAFAKYKKFKEEQDKLNLEVEKPIPSDILRELEKTFDPWIVADKRYLNAKVEQLKCIDDTDAAKKPLAEELSKHCEAALANEAIGEFPVLTSWYTFQQGRIYSIVQNEDKASEAWKTVLDVETGSMPEAQRNQIFLLQRNILPDLVKMLMRAKRYAAVVSTIAEAKLNAVLKQVFEETAGKDLMIDYAKALTLPVADASGVAEFEKALTELRALIEKENLKGSPMWANNFARTMAELLLDARKKAVRPRLGAEEWYSASYGFFVLGQNEWKKHDEMSKTTPPAEPEKLKAQFALAYDNYDNAVDYYRRAIAEARKERTGLATRLDIEPKSWFEMGLCYLKMKHYYEAVVVYQAMRSTFQPDRRKLWMPDPVKEKKQYTKEITEMLEKLDKPKEGLMSKCASNIIFALDQNAAIHTDLWNARLKSRVLNENPQDGPDDGGINDKDYLTAKSDLDYATAFVAQAKNMTDKKEIEKTYKEAADKYVSAALLFAKVKDASLAYEPALYQAASCHTLAQEVWVSGKLGFTPEAEKQSKDLAGKALENFKKYQEFVAKAEKAPPKETDPDKVKEEKERREKLRGGMLLACNSMHSGAEDWEKAVTSSDDYIAWERRQPNQTKSSIDIALLNKFRALVELAANTPDKKPRIAPDCDPYIRSAEEVMNEILKRKPADKKLHQFMFAAVSRRCMVAISQLDLAVKDSAKKKDDDKSKLSADQLKEYESKSSSYWEKVTELRVKQIKMAEDEANPGDRPTIEDYCSLLNLFDRARRRKEAADIANKLLKLFDPYKSNMRVLDDAKIWRPLLLKLVGDTANDISGIIVYNDLTKVQNCWRDHSVLVDLMFDTTEGVNAADQKNRPKYDLQNVDMEKALQQVESIKRAYPDCASLPDKSKQPNLKAKKAVEEWVDEAVKHLDGMLKDAEKIDDAEHKELASRCKFMIEYLKQVKDKAFLTIIEEEIDFRRKIIAARDRLSLLAMEVSQQVKDAEEARTYREMANEQIKILLKVRGDTPAGQFLSAELDILDGKYEEALDMLYKIKNMTPDKDSETYFDSSKKISEVYAKLGKWEDASEYPKFVALTAGFDSKRVRERWESLREFLQQCADKGVKLPPALLEKMKAAGKAADPAAAPKPDEKKDAPKDEKPDAKKDEAKPN
jgi:hypothetical protein